jgi:hypothetical protein
MIALSFRADRSGIEEWSELGSRDMDGQAGGRASGKRVSQSLAVNQEASRRRST